MVELVTRNFWWLGITKEMKRYVEGYDACQQTKIAQSNQPAN